MPEPPVELLTLGNEILQGDVLDTNSHWLCRQLVVRGARVARISVLPDVVDVIVEGVRAALARRPALILTCGGLGSTTDDLTVAAVAQALGRRAREDPAALAMVRDFYAHLHAGGHVEAPDVTPARLKMAVLPEGGQPLLNSVGAAPGILLSACDTQIACLPGVPAEMKAIFEESLWPRLAARFARSIFVERTIPTDNRDESAMSPAVNAVAARHPDVYVKSRAQVYASGVANFVTLSARAADRAEAERLLDAAEADLRSALAGLGVTAGERE